MWELGSQTLDKAVTVKLTRTLAIIPITLVLSGVSTRETLKTCDYRPGIVLDGVGDIPVLTRAKKELNTEGAERNRDSFPLLLY